MVLDEVASYLQTAGVGTIGFSLFKGMVPMDAPAVATPDALVALIEIPGLPPVHVHNIPEPALEQNVLQILTRGAPFGYAAARVRAQAAFVALTSVHNQTLSGVVYLGILALQSPFFLKNDDLNRPYIIFNIRVQKALS